jgi:hypothetical protein
MAPHPTDISLSDAVSELGGQQLALVLNHERRKCEERQIRLMTNSCKPQSEKLATGGGRGTTAVKPDNN